MTKSADPNEMVQHVVPWGDLLEQIRGQMECKAIVHRLAHGTLIYIFRDLSMDAVFYTTFYRTNGPGHHAAFYVDQLPPSWKTIEEYLAVCAEELEEEWGEPDWSSSHTPNSFGCICYNLHPQMHEKLLNLWRQTFSEQWPQCVVGPVCAIDAHTVKITDMLQTTKDAYEHQQAQQLRDTLTAHVSNGVVAQSKKM